MQPLNSKRRELSLELSSMENLCMANGRYKTRPRRGVVKQLTAPGGLLGGNCLCYVDNHQLFVNHLAVEGLVLTAGEKQLIAMGSQVLIFPDKKWYDTLTARFGSLENIVTAASVSVTLCDGNGVAYPAWGVSPNGPLEPADGQLWMDTSGSPHVLRRYRLESGRWEEQETYLKLAAPNLGMGFRPGDAVAVTGFDRYRRLTDAGDGFVLFPGTVDGNTDWAQVTVSRTLPDMDFVAECGTRLFGCKYGTVAGGAVNTIYASAPGDAFNWHTDAAFSSGRSSDGPWTGVAALSGKVHFFKENAIETLYPSSLSLEVLPGRGVKKGAHKSLCRVGEALYYQSAAGVCCFDGGLPKALLGMGSGTVGGSIRGRYYLSGEALSVYDPAAGRWLREDGIQITCFCQVDNEGYAIDSENRLLALFGSEGTLESDLPFAACTGLFGLDAPGHKYVSTLFLRMKLSGTASLYFSADQAPWTQVRTLESRELKVLRIPMLPKRCDHYRLKIAGTGQMELYGIWATVEEGRT